MLDQTNPKPEINKTSFEWDSSGQAELTHTHRMEDNYDL